MKAGGGKKTYTAKEESWVSWLLLLWSTEGRNVRLGEAMQRVQKGEEASEMRRRAGAKSPEKDLGSDASGSGRQPPLLCPAPKSSRSPLESCCSSLLVARNAAKGKQAEHYSSFTQIHHLQRKLIALKAARNTCSRSLSPGHRLPQASRGFLGLLQQNLTSLYHSGKNVAANYVKNDSQGWYSRRSSEADWDKEREGKRRELMASEEELEQLEAGPVPKLNVLKSAPAGMVQPAPEVAVEDDAVVSARSRSISWLNQYRNYGRTTRLLSTLSPRPS